MATRKKAKTKKKTDKMTPKQRQILKTRAPHGTGIGQYARECIRKGWDNQRVLGAVLKKFPQAKTSLGCINWYRNDMRNVVGEKVPTAREAGGGRRSAPKVKKKKTTAKAKKKTGKKSDDIFA